MTEMGVAANTGSIAASSEGVDDVCTVFEVVGVEGEHDTNVLGLTGGLECSTTEDNGRSESAL